MRLPHELGALITAAHDDNVSLEHLLPGLRTVANALNDGELCRARIAAVQLRLPVLPDTLAYVALRIEDVSLRLERGAERLARYNDNHYGPGLQGGQFAPKDRGEDANGAAPEQIALAPTGAGAADSRVDTPYVAQDYRRFTQQVGDGECAPLVEKAIGAAGKTAKMGFAYLINIGTMTR